MQGTKAPTFRPTLALWPSEPPTGVRVTRYATDAIHQGTAPLGEVLSRDPLPEDFVLREVMDATPDTVGELMADFGPLARIRRRTLGAKTMAWVQKAEAVRNLLTLQALVDVYLADLRGDRDTMLTAWEHCHLPVAADEAETWWRWGRIVNDALTAFPMHVRTGAERDDDEDGPTVYEASVLQLVAMAVEGRQVHVCANENCGRPFTRHRSERRKLGTERAHSAGIKYCSQLCAKAQSERDRRRRRRAEREA